MVESFTAMVPGLVVKATAAKLERVTLAIFSRTETTNNNKTGRINALWDVQHSKITVVIWLVRFN